MTPPSTLPQGLVYWHTNYVTGDRIYWDNTTNSGINTGIYFVTAINQTDFLSFI